MSIMLPQERNWQMERATRLSQMENSIPVFIRRRLFILTPVLVHSSNVNDLEADLAP